MQIGHCKEFLKETWSELIEELWVVGVVNTISILVFFMLNVLCNNQ